MAGRSVVVYEASCQKEEALRKAVDRIRWDAQGRTPILILFFSSNLRFYYFSSKLHEEFPDTTVVGAVSDMNISSDGMGEEGLSALAVFEGVQVSAGIITDIATYPLKHAPEIRESMMRLSDVSNTVCLEFTTSLVMAEELVLDTLKECLEGTGIPAVGSSTGVANESIMTYVSLNGDVYSEGTVYLFIRNEWGRIGIYREMMYRKSGFKFTATDVDCEDRSLLEIDSRPAALYLEDKLSMKKSELLSYLHYHPLGRIVDDDIYITSVADVTNNSELNLYARVYNRTKLTLLEPRDFEETWNETLEAIHRDYPGRSFSVMINCCVRTGIFKEKGVLSKFREKFMNECGGYVGISGSGEHYNFEHTNQTMLMVVFE